MIQPLAFITRVTEHSDLSPQALLVAVQIARLRFGKHLKSHESFALSGAQLAQACHMSERTLDRYLGECLKAGWIVGVLITRTTGEGENRQRPTEYYLADPTDESECKRLHAQLALRGKFQRAGVAGKPRRRLHTLVRSNKSADGAASPQASVPSSTRTTEEFQPAPLHPEPRSHPPYPDITAMKRAQMELDALTACAHGDPRGSRYCAFCKRAERRAERTA